MEFTADISKYIDAGVELAKKHPVCTTLVIVLVFFIVVTPIIGSNWIDFLDKIKHLFDNDVDPVLEEPEKDTPPPVENPVSSSGVQHPKENFDLADLDEEQICIMQNLVLMANNRTLPAEVKHWIGCDESTLDELVNTGWLIRMDRGYKVPAVVREVVLMNEVPVEAVEKFFSFVAYGEYFKDGEDSSAVQFKLGIVNNVLEKVANRLEENQDISALYYKLGSVHYGQRTYARAESYFKKALNISIKVCGENHLDTAARYQYLGCAYHGQRNYILAEKCYQKALDINRKLLGEAHPNMAAIYGNLGLVYRQQGKYDKAVELYRKGWKIRQQKLGSEHPDTQSIKNDIRNCFPYIDHGDQDFDTWLSQQ